MRESNNLGSFTGVAQGSAKALQEYALNFSLTEANSLVNVLTTSKEKIRIVFINMLCFAIVYQYDRHRRLVFQLHGESNC